jgi:hydroxymethylbilane synthase
LRLGTRGSLLARTQSMMVADLLERANPGVRVEMRIIRTTGDVVVDRPLHDVGGKGLFTKELEQALLAGEIDFAVHSFKDVPVTMPLVDQSDLLVAAVPAREDPRDVLVSRAAKYIEDLPQGARVGTGSLRRRCQLIQLRPDLLVEPVRGNIDTRMRKMQEGQYDAVVLALAGVKRTELFDPEFMNPIAPEQMLPAAGQGRAGASVPAGRRGDGEAALDLERRDDRRVRGRRAEAGESFGRRLPLAHCGPRDGAGGEPDPARGGGASRGRPAGHRRGRTIRPQRARRRPGPGVPSSPQPRRAGAPRGRRLGGGGRGVSRDRRRPNTLPNHTLAKVFVDC